jgi:putative transposase
MVTASTLHKQHFFRDNGRLQVLQDTLLSLLEKYSWTMQAWAIFVNHYHWVARAAEAGPSLRELIEELHSITAMDLNRLDQTLGRRIWFQYWDTRLTYEKSWLVRLNYVNDNAVHHGLVRTPTAYPYCSAAWFEKNANPGFRRKVRSFKYDRLKVADDF